MPATLSTLPPELLFVIAPHLPVPALFALLQTSHHFHHHLLHTLYARGLTLPPDTPTILDWSLTHRQPAALTYLRAHFRHPSTDPDTPLYSADGLAKSWYRWSTSPPTPLLAAVFSGDLPATAALLALGATPAPREAEDAETPLHAAARRGHTGLVGMLVSAGADVDARTRTHSSTPLWIAAHAHMWEAGSNKVDTLDAIRALVRAGADTEAKDARGDTPLFEALGSGYVAAVEVLVGEGADVCARDGEGATVLHRAAGKGDLGSVRVLVVAGADVAALWEGRTALTVYREQKELYKQYLASQAWEGEDTVTGFGEAGEKEMLEMLKSKAEVPSEDQSGELEEHV